MDPEEFNKLLPWQQLKLEFQPYIRQLAEMLKADVSLQHSLGLAKILDDAFELRVRTFYDASFNGGYQRGREEARQESEYYILKRMGLDEDDVDRSPKP